MTKGTPITYEHAGYGFLMLLAFFAAISTIFFWAGVLNTIGTPQTYDGINSIWCYNSDGTGPLSQCPVELKCSTSANSNGNDYQTACPPINP